MEALDSPSTAKFAFDAALANITARWDRILIWEQYWNPITLFNE